jgi:hypothetical protein
MRHVCQMRETRGRQTDRRDKPRLPVVRSVVGCFSLTHVWNLIGPSEGSMFHAMAAFSIDHQNKDKRSKKIVRKSSCSRKTKEFIFLHHHLLILIDR